MDSLPTQLIEALRRTVANGPYQFEHYLGARSDHGISMTTQGYVDFDGPIVAAEMAMDLLPEEQGDILRMWTYHSGSTIFQATSADGAHWVSLEAHGIGATTLAMLYWLYGVRDVSETGTTGRYRFTLHFPAIFRTAPEPEAASLRRGLHETRTDLINRSAEGIVEITPDHLIRYVEIELPGYQGPDPELSQPPSTVTLTLTRTGRREIALPEPDAQMSPDTFMKVLLAEHH
ncbi:MAG TPA: hypothetical protein VK453_07940 [Micromonosporaceae bacterium]|nr:hypothetical protein [Micromonosporaceae bacterium]